MKGWEKVVADLSLSEGTVLVFRKIEAYTFLLTSFMKVAPYPHCEQKFVMFTSISSFVDKKYIESFCHFVNDHIVERLLRGAMKVYVNAWNWFDVFIEKDSLSKCYFYGDGWKKVVGFLGLNEKCVVGIRYLFYYNFLLTVFDVNRCKVLVPKAAMENTAGGVDKYAGQPSNATSVVVELPDNQRDFDDESDSMDEDSDYDDSGDGSSGSDISMDDFFYDEDDEDSGGSSDDAKDDPDYHPV
ncbi:hypothetical protein HanRHA438_Chr15g0712851 [Helianthus annuus]|uniref:DNA-binding pseudobarrel domain-containing protein n=1 Tax=Helianthus annuus TaxID=4232 RepID=A0A9K3H2P0_HELAN|nr:hypothetical protein HanXRQr2_Chr15g0700651 [Helianthus annuus]KAJ0451740.1 hypothetical protein HanHA300_Chr15g0571011 [Helianthus annuus]KAJ0473626.1 hypothetical protein HanHA89_Chr15g0620481 [Helianthus annuus]KAJ0649203.1 hypothetical protein HanLR1_Chr15g0581581 [Helianthus annuus]KAJ0653004.1 hypothetical protein HanOQP8_Chr15g0578611 [Helianthus annuus]